MRNSSSSAKWDSQHYTGFFFFFCSEHPWFPPPSSHCIFKVFGTRWASKQDAVNQPSSSVCVPLHSERINNGLSWKQEDQRAAGSHSSALGFLAVPLSPKSSNSPVLLLKPWKLESPMETLSGLQQTARDLQNWKERVVRCFLLCGC